MRASAIMTIGVWKTSANARNVSRIRFIVGSIPNVLSATCPVIAISAQITRWMMKKWQNRSPAIASRTDGAM